MNRINSKPMQLAESVAEAGLRVERRRMTVGEVMTTSPSTVGSETTALDLVRMFHNKKFRHLLVTDPAGELIGVISDRDVIGCFSPIRPLTKDDLRVITTTRLMSRDLLTVGPETPLLKAVRLMLKHGISCLPVVTGGSIEGILTSTDLQVLLQLLLETSASETPEESAASATA